MFVNRAGVEIAEITFTYPALTLRMARMSLGATSKISTDSVTIDTLDQE